MMKLKFFESKKRRVYNETEHLDFQGQFITVSIPFKVRFTVIASSDNNDLGYIDAIFGLNDVEFITSRGNILKGGMAYEFLKPWLLSELRRNEVSIYNNTIHLSRDGKNYSYSYKVLNDTEPYSIEFRFSDDETRDGWTTMIETDGFNIIHKDALNIYQIYPFIKKEFDSTVVNIMNDIREFKKIKLY